MSADKDQSGGERATHRFRHDAMACTFGLALVESDGVYAERAARAAWEEVDRLEQELSRFAPLSDVAGIAGLQAGAELRLGPDVYECLDLAARLCQETGGAFDVTVVESGGGLPRVSREDEPLLELDEMTHSIKARRAGVQVDLGGIGKGYALDCVAALLQDWRIEAGMVDAGRSTVVAWGEYAQGAGWPVEVRDPRKADKAWGAVYLRGQAFSGSGQVLHGQHIVNPRTGKPADAALAAWARAPTGALADALSTAFMVMTLEEVQLYSARHAEVSALLALPVSTRVELISFGSGYDDVKTCSD